MTLNQNSAEGKIPETTRKMAKQVFAKGNVYVRLRDELGVIYSDEQFKDLFRLGGQQAYSPGQLAMVVIFQHWEGLSDRDAAEAVRARIDWKYALGLELESQGFDHTVLTEFRGRLTGGGAEQRLLDRILELAKDRKLIKGRGKQRTDSTYVLAAVRTLNRLSCVHETMRHTLDELAVDEPKWLQSIATDEWYALYSERLGSFELKIPESLKKQEEMAVQIGHDGQQLLEAIYASNAPALLRWIPAVQTLRRVWIQQFIQTDEQGLKWRDSDDLPPNSKLIVSPHDEEARLSRHGEKRWTGYSVVVTETCDSGLPKIVTHVDVVHATTPDKSLTSAIQTALADKELLPDTHYVDGGFVSADTLQNSSQEHGVDLFGPAQRDSTQQHRAQAGFDAGSFKIDWTTKTATCPQEQISSTWSQSTITPNAVQITFPKRVCAPCPVKEMCTRSPGRALKIYAQPFYDALTEARKRMTTPEFWKNYAIRAGIEGTLSHMVHSFGQRRSRYIGLTKTRLQFVATAVARSLSSIASWFDSQLNEPPPCRKSRFARLRLASL